MQIKIIKKKISKQELAELAKENFGDMIKVDVDVKQGILAAGGEYHADGQEMLVEREGSDGQNVWGVNFYPFRPPEERIDYRALINLKPALGIKDTEIQDRTIRQKIKEIINKLLLDDDETITP